MVIVYGIIEKHGIEGLIIATLMAGIMLILMGLLNLGDLIKFIPKTITVVCQFQDHHQEEER